MDSLPLVPVVLCGGSGTRLWPLSRASLPKPFVRLHGEHSLLQQALRRSAALTPAAPLLLASERARFLVTEQLDEIGMTDATLLLEPVARGTAAAIASAAFHLLREHDDALMLVLPSDHLLNDTDAFAAEVSSAAHAAHSGWLMSFGIVPTGPDTRFGYLQPGAELAGGARRIDGYTAPSSCAQAEQLIASAQALWNSGIYVFACRSLLQALAEHAPLVCAAAERAEHEAVRHGSAVRLDATAYADSPDLSIEQALIARTVNAAVLALKAGWSDIGSWSAVWESAPHDHDGNAVCGDVVLDDCRDCHVHGGRRLVAASGLDGLVIVDTDDALLVLPKAQSQRTRALVKRLQHDGRAEWREHRHVQRPWGSYQVLATGERHQVKCLTVRPGASLSLQKHHHRAEHWTVVSGTAQVTRGDDSLLLAENQSVYIGVGVVHALANPGKLPLQLIEVQCGGYLGEDDIVRLSDPYGRTG